MRGQRRTRAPLDKQTNSNIIRTNVQLVMALMTQTNRLALNVETLAVPAPEVHPLPTVPALALPNLSKVLAEFSPLPRQALFLGVAHDGLPVFLNLDDPVPGPLLIIGDAKAGKTRLLQTIAQGAGHVHEPRNVKYSVITDRPDEWGAIQDSANCEEVLSTGDSAAADYLTSLAGWAHANRGERQTVLILIDNLNSLIASSADACQSLRWLLFRGPSRRVWPIATLNTNLAKSVPYWLEAFRTRLFAYIESPADAERLAGRPIRAVGNLVAGSQFCLPEGGEWLPFWIPNLD